MGGAELGGMKWDLMPASGPGQREMSEGSVKDGSWGSLFCGIFLYAHTLDRLLTCKLERQQKPEDKAHRRGEGKGQRASDRLPQAS